jgi:hypothetical protein
MSKKQEYAFSKEDLLQVLDYDKENGCFYNKKTRGAALNGYTAGCKKANGYVYVGVFRRQILCHRLVWFVEHGVWPLMVLDHIDGDKSNNRILNLRLATYSQNSINRKVMANSKTQLKGVWFNKKKNRYRACVRCDNKRIYLGSYRTPEEAHAAYVAKAAELHQEFMRTN